MVAESRSDNGMSLETSTLSAEVWLRLGRFKDRYNLEANYGFTKEVAKRILFTDWRVLTYGLDG